MQSERTTHSYLQSKSSSLDAQRANSCNEAYIQSQAGPAVIRNSPPIICLPQSCADTHICRHAGQDQILDAFCLEDEIKVCSKKPLSWSGWMTDSIVRVSSSLHSCLRQQSTLDVPSPCLEAGAHQLHKRLLCLAYPLWALQIRVEAQEQSPSQAHPSPRFFHNRVRPFLFQHLQYIARSMLEARAMSSSLLPRQGPEEGSVKRQSYLSVLNAICIELCVQGWPPRKDASLHLDCKLLRLLFISDK